MVLSGVGPGVAIRQFHGEVEVSWGPEYLRRFNSSGALMGCRVGEWLLGQGPPGMGSFGNASFGTTSSGRNAVEAGRWVGAFAQPSTT